MIVPYNYKKVRPGLFEIATPSGKAVGRIRHVISPDVGWEASDGGFYSSARDAALALVARANRAA